VSASISCRGHFTRAVPVVVKVRGRDATILENNIVQTAGSAGESIAFGLGVTMPAIMIWVRFGAESSDARRFAGRAAGNSDDDPAPRALIVAQHQELKYPEGTACAEVLKAGVRMPNPARSPPRRRKPKQPRPPSAAAQVAQCQGGVHRLRHRSGLQRADEGV